MGRNLYSGVFQDFLKVFSSFFQPFVFQAQSGTPNGHRTGSSDISNKSVICKICLKIFPGVEKNWFQSFDFSFNFEQVSKLTLVYLCLI